MYFLRYRAMPAKTHPDRDRYGEAYVCCWVDRRTLASADRVARRDIKSQRWSILARETARKVTEANTDEHDNWLGYYRQAIIDKEVFVYHLSPRYPVYIVVAAVENGERHAEAVYFITGEALLRRREEDVSVPGFWDARRRKKAVASARAAIRNAAWKVISILNDWPCGRGDLAKDMTFYYDEAEQDGACLVFVHEIPE